MINLGIIQQLMATRLNKHFASLEISYSQFELLTHFSNNPTRSWTITELAEVMEMNQPGITKVVSTLNNKKLLASNKDTQDARKRHLSITPQGLKLCGEIFNSLLPDASYVLGGWKDNELFQMQNHLEKLMHWLDNHRDDIKL